MFCFFKDFWNVQIKNTDIEDVHLELGRRGGYLENNSYVVISVNTAQGTYKKRKEARLAGPSAGERCVYLRPANYSAFSGLTCPLFLEVSFVQMSTPLRRVACVSSNERPLKVCNLPISGVCLTLQSAVVLHLGRPWSGLHQRGLTDSSGWPGLVWAGWL